MNTTAKLAALAGFLSISLGGCAALEGNELGETDINTEFQGNSVERIEATSGLVQSMAEAGLNGEQISAVMSAVTRPLPSSMQLRDGKDKASVSWSVDIAKGNANYSASEVVATDPAEVKAKIAETAGDDAVEAIENAFPDGIQGLIRTLTGGSGL